MTSLTADVTLINSELTKIKPYEKTEKEIRSVFCLEVAKIAQIYAPPPGVNFNNLNFIQKSWTIL